MAAELGSFSRRIRTAAREESLNEVHELLAKLWVHDPLDGRRRIEFESAVAEIAANIIEHTSGDTVTMTLEVRALPDRVEARFEDDGDPVSVDLTAVELPDELAERGRGLVIAATVLDRLDYRRDGTVNTWTLSRNRAG
ncbi:ATP-binding protein [Rhodococcus sp. NCIMB 12038]|uniref:ATP-binding protein n=1 Tax=Rhodococcus sp. NCIMB 12038 TaxID=933800 RepID=UPI000B3C039A|nr:ATP-binding protein [Rhodococcus sp. NCIMB 12038]OUS91753.1 ATP-binding protein [Rhodococcus sp. NCIMB 12038]